MLTQEQRKWCRTAYVNAGSFVSTFAVACLKADDENAELLKDSLNKMIEKYPQYSTMKEPE
jgi:hypothetical protein